MPHAAIGNFCGKIMQDEIQHSNTKKMTSEILHDMKIPKGDANGEHI